MRTVAFVVLQMLLTVLALATSVWAAIPWLALVSFGVLGASAITAELSSAPPQHRLWSLITFTAWAGTWIVPLGCLLLPERRYPFSGFLDYYYAMLAWLIVATILPVTHRSIRPGLSPRWKILLTTLAAAGVLVWLVTAYLENQRVQFQLGLLLVIALLILCHLCFQTSTIVIVFTNTLVLLATVLFCTTLLARAGEPAPADPQALKRFHSFHAARANPKAFEEWWSYYGGELFAFERIFLVKDPQSPVPIRVRPGSHGKLFQSEVSINSKGFRGKEISENKGNAYRIVTLGESTTFGITFNLGDKPWPELLEQLIRERLKPERTVEVINAGVPAITMPETLNRLPDEILPLRPDLIICYHGINGFSLLDDAVPPLRGKPPPRYHKRPVRLLADCEYRLKLFYYNLTSTGKQFSRRPTFSNLMHSKYTRTYERLIDIARTNKIRLVIANFSLAVNSQSPPELVEFFRPRHPSVHWQIQANAAHHQVVRQLARDHPEVSFADVQPHIEGAEEKFFDLMHLTQEGDQQLAENFFASIRAVLEADLITSATAPISGR